MTSSNNPLKTSLTIQNGAKLSVKKIEQINKIWQNEFPEDESITVQNRATFKKDTFFTVYNQKGELLSSGRLRPAKLTFLEKTYNIQGIADIVSATKGKGYGKLLMIPMLDYLKDRNQTGVGFCTKANSAFYSKCGFKIAEDLVERFTYITPKGKTEKDAWDKDVFYVTGTDNLIETILANQKEEVNLLCSFW